MMVHESLSEVGRVNSDDGYDGGGWTVMIMMIMMMMGWVGVRDIIFASREGFLGGGLFIYIYIFPLFYQREEGEGKK